MAGILLDTCALIWIMNGDEITDAARTGVETASAEGCLWVSPISAWEIATLVRKDRIALSMTPEIWFEKALSLPGVGLAPMPPETLMASAFLPGNPPNDPADRIILATARMENLTVVTRDKVMIAYADSGHVKLMKC